MREYIRKQGILSRILNGNNMISRQSDTPVAVQSNSNRIPQKQTVCNCIQMKRNYDNSHLDIMRQSKVRFSQKNLLFTVANKYSKPQILFMESGNVNAGGWHIINRHLLEFMKSPYNLASGDAIANFLDKRFTDGNYAIGPDDRGYKITIEIDPDHFIKVPVGNNGFVVSAYPESEKTPDIKGLPKYKLCGK